MSDTPQTAFEALHAAARLRDAEALLAVAEPVSIIEFCDYFKEHWFTHVFEPSDMDRRLVGVPWAAKAAASYEQYVASERERLRRDFGVETQEELSALSPPQLIRGALQGLHADLWLNFSCVVLGQVFDGPDIAYVVYKHSSSDLDGPLPEVARLHRSTSGWKVCLARDNEAGVPGLPRGSWGYMDERMDDPPEAAV